MLTNAEVEVAADVTAGLKTGLVRQRSFSGRRKISRTADQPGHPLGDGVQNLGAGVAPGHALGVGGKFGNIGIPAFRQLALGNLLPLRCQLRILLFVRREFLIPRGLGLVTALPRLAHMLSHFFRHQELRIYGPAVARLSQSDFFFAQRLAMRRRSVVLVGRAPGDVAIHDDERRPRGLLQCILDRFIEQREIVGIAHPLHIPVVGHEARRHVVAESQGGVAFDGDVIVVVDPQQIGKFEVSGQRRCFVRDSFHQTTIAANGVHTIIKKFVVWAIEARCQPALRDRHAHRIGHTLAERAGGGLDSGRQPILRMPGALRIPLAEALQLI